jgi:hypothetical protein
MVTIFLLSAQVLQVGVINKLNQIMAKFLWFGSSHKCIYWVAWSVISLPIEEGGIRSASDQGYYSSSQT